MLAQASVPICDMAQLRLSRVKMDMLNGAHLRLLYYLRSADHDEPLGTNWRINLRITSGWCSPAARKSIRPLESVWSQDFHLPIFARARTRDGHPPLSWLVAQRVLDMAMMSFAS
jgi:hypothetical protein